MTSIQETVDKLIASGRTKQDVLSELHNAVDMLRCMPDPGFEAPLGIMKASAKWDVSHVDKLGKHRSRIEAEGDKPMLNVVEIPNEGQITSEFPDRPAIKNLLEINCEYNLKDHKRNFVLIIEDMEKEYESFVDYVTPNCARLIKKFRELNLPIIWTNWARTADDGHYGAIDRFYGGRGAHIEGHPCYTVDGDAAQTVDDLSPLTDNERSCHIQSFHLSKFADLDDQNREILYPLLEAWGVDTIILTGAWTDDCIAATAFEAVDRYGYDCVLVTDAIATATVNGAKMVDCLSGAVCKLQTSHEVADHLTENPDLVARPKAALNGNVRFTFPRQRR